MKKKRLRKRKKGKREKQKETQIKRKRINKRYIEKERDTRLSNRDRDPWTQGSTERVREEDRHCETDRQTIERVCAFMGEKDKETERKRKNKDRQREKEKRKRDSERKKIKREREREIDCVPSHKVPSHFQRLVSFFIGASKKEISD